MVVVPVLLMLDEFAQLGPLLVIENNLAMMRGYGVKLWAVFQDLSQAQAIYKERWESCLGNAGVRSPSRRKMSSRRSTSQSASG